jgi:hypothetical protein
VYVGYSAVVKNWAIREYRSRGYLFNEWTEVTKLVVLYDTFFRM